MSFRIGAKGLVGTFCRKLPSVGVLDIDIQIDAHLSDVLIGSHESKVPTLLLLEAADELVDLLCIVLGGSILIAIGDDGDRSNGAWVQLDLYLEAGERHADRVEQWGTSAGNELVLTHEFNLLGWHHIENIRHRLGVEEHKRNKMLLGVSMLLGSSFDAIKHLIATAESGLADGRHRTRFVEDDQVVDSGFGCRSEMLVHSGRIKKS